MVIFQDEADCLDRILFRSDKLVNRQASLHLNGPKKPDRVKSLTVKQLPGPSLPFVTHDSGL